MVALLLLLLFFFFFFSPPSSLVVDVVVIVVVLVWLVVVIIIIFCYDDPMLFRCGGVPFLRFHKWAYQDTPRATLGTKSFSTD